MVNAVILAAGKGSRMKSKTKKQYIELLDKPILYYSIDKFLKIKSISKIVIVVDKDDFKKQVFNKFLSTYAKYIDEGKIHFVSGGKERYDSVYNALSYIDEYIGVKNNDKVLIHDSARPNVDVKDITKLIKYLSKYKAISLAYRLSDSIKKIKKSTGETKLVLNSVDRDSYYLISTPQGFDFKTLYESYKKFIASSLNIKITDDLQIVEYFSKCQAFLLDSSKLNFKITTKDDLNVLKYII